MNDIRRTILWVIFGFSMVLLWDQWQIYNGNKPTFFGHTAQNAAAPAEGKPGADASGAVPVSSTASAQGQVPAQANTAAPRVRTTVKTDVLSLVIDSEGASIVQADLLAYKDHVKHDGNMRLLDDAKGLEYLAQSGLILSDAQAAAPTHRTPMRLVSKDTELKPGQDKLEVVFESDPVGGLVVVKKYTLERGQYLVHSAFDVINKGNAAVQPQLYVQLVRNGNKPAGESSFYSTFTGPAVYTGQKKYQKVEFADIQKGKAEYEKQ